MTVLQLKLSDVLCSKAPQFTELGNRIVGDIIRMISSQKEKGPVFLEVDESALQKIVISESDQEYLAKQVDQKNKEGLFKGNRSLCKKGVPIVQEVNSEYPYPGALTSTLLEASNQVKDRFEGNFEFLKSIDFNSIMANNG
jgi:hypothetical protein